MGIWSVKVIEGSILSGRARTGSATTLKDDAKNMAIDAFKDKLIKINIDGAEYVRKITANTADTFTFATLGAAVAAKAVIAKTGGGKVTITADPAGAYANDYMVKTVEAESEVEGTKAEFADGILKIMFDAGTGALSSAEVKTAVEAIEGTPFTVVVDTAGTIDLLESPVSFSDGSDEVKPVDRTEYFVINDPVLDIPNSVPITPSDAADLPQPTRRIYIGVDGDLEVVRTGGQTVIYRNLCAGYHYISATRIKAAGTTALNILAEW